MPVETVLKQLSAYPVLQAIVGLAMALACVWMFVRAEKDKKTALPPPAPMEMSHIYMQGPLQAALSALAAITGILQRIETNQDSTQEKLVRQSETQERYIRAVERNSELLAEAVTLMRAKMPRAKL